MAKGIFVTGSGTGVGKTYVSMLLMGGLSELGYGVTYMKPVETGCSCLGMQGDVSIKDVLINNVSASDVLIGDDTRLALGLTSCKSSDIPLHSPYRFAPACSPHLAARGDNVCIDINHIVSTYKTLVDDTGADVVIVEGAGGALVPISDDEYMVDVMRALCIPAVLVTTPALGTLNHTFLSLRELDRCGVDVVGVAINNVGGVDRDYIYEDNVASIRRYVGAIPCIDIGYGGIDKGHHGINKDSCGINNDHDGINNDYNGIDKDHDGINKSTSTTIKDFCDELAKRI